MHDLSLRAVLLSAALVCSVAATGQPSRRRRVPRPPSIGTPWCRGTTRCSPTRPGVAAHRRQRRVRVHRDVTGLQSFPEPYDSTIPLCTLSQLGLAHRPLPGRLANERSAHAEYDSYGRKVGYATSPATQRHAGDRLASREPPSSPSGSPRVRLHPAEGQPPVADSLATSSRRSTCGPVTFAAASRSTAHRSMSSRSASHADLRRRRVRLTAGGAKRLAVRVRFPVRVPRHDRRGLDVVPNGTRLGVRWKGTPGRRRADARRGRVPGRRSLGAFRCRVADGRPRLPRRARRLGRPVRLRRRVLASAGLAGRSHVRRHAGGRRRHWAAFWKSGARDRPLGAARIPRWRELERRIVLSQYLTAIQAPERCRPRKRD